MVDYSLPVARRTRGKRPLMFEEHSEHSKKITKNNRADSDSDNVRAQISSGNLGKSGQRAKLPDNRCVKHEMENEFADVSDDSDDASVEEIDAVAFSKEGRGSVTYAASASSGFENVKKFKTGLERIEKRNLAEINLKDEVVLVDVEEGFDSANSRSSISKSVGCAENRDFICIDVDDEDDNSALIPDDIEKGDPVNSPNKSTWGSNCFNFNGCESGGSLHSAESEEQEKSEESLRTAAEKEFTESESSSSDEDSDDSSDGTYDLPNESEESLFSECSSSSSEKDNESFHAESSRKVSRRGRKKGVKWLEAGLSRRKSYGLDILVDLPKDQQHICVAQRTRSRYPSRFNSRFANTEFGTFSQPVCLDEEESDFLPNEKQSDSSSRHENSDSFDDTNSDVEETLKRRRKPWSTKKKTGFDNPTDDDSLPVESSHGEKKVWINKKKTGLDNLSGEDSLQVEGFHAGKKTWHDKRAPGTCEGNQSECWPKVPPKNWQELKSGTQLRGPRKNLDIFNILVDSIFEDKELPLEERVFVGGDNSHVAETALPLKFSFKFEESPPPEKSEEEKELDNLWAELEFVLRSSDIGGVDSDMAENKNVVPTSVEQANLCLHGDHRLILDEQVGLKCTICSYVKEEIKYILPSFCTSPFGKSQKRESNSFDHGKFDNFQEDLDCDSHNESDSHAHCGRTVWDIIPGIRNNMYPHQREGFEFIWKNVAGGINLDELKERNGLDNGNGCIVSHAPGTGKTRLTIVFLQTYMELYPTCRPMIIAPSSMLLTWEEEFLKWKVDIPFHNLNKRDYSYKENIAAVNFLMQAGHSGQSADIVRLVKLFSWKKERSILGVSYRLFEKLAGVRKNPEGDKIKKILLELPDLVVFDEGHIPRNADSLIWMGLSKLKTERRIILSGTPFQNNFIEFFNTLRLVRPKFEDTNTSRDNGCIEKKRGRPKGVTRGKWDILTSSIGKASEDSLKCARLKEIRALINPFVHVYRGNILQEKLPGLKESVVILKPTELQKSLLQSIHARNNCFEIDYAESLISVHPSLMLKCDKEDFVVDRDMLEASRLNPDLGVKIKLLLEIIRLSEALNEKVLIFSQYIEPLSFIKEHLESHFKWIEGTELFYMSGKRDMKKRQSLINTFNDPTSEVRVLLASTKACSEGINLVGASRVILLDVVWNPSVERQAICRAYRLGQKKVVYIYHLITSKTREEEKYSRQVEKDRLSELVFSPDHRSNQENISSTVLDDRILEAILQHEKLQKMFEKIAYQSKESTMGENFDLVEKQ